MTAGRYLAALYRPRWAAVGRQELEAGEIRRLGLSTSTAVGGEPAVVTFDD
jgi:hypothetical protein